MDVRSKFMLTARELCEAMIEREDEVRLVLTGLVAQEHVLLVGPPGCGKSMLLDAVMKWANGSKFGLLLNKFTVPEEIVGPVSVVGLKADKYLRITTGKLPEAEFAFLDEVFKGSSAILNTLLKILNERTFDKGDGVCVKVPLKLCVGASNEWPSTDTGKELGALFDRFVLRHTVRPISTQAGRERLLWGGDLTPKLSTEINAEELAWASSEAARLPWSADGMEAMREILRQLASEGIVPGDRRQVKAVKVARAFAWLSGADEVKPDHLEILAAVLWDDPAEQPAKCAQVVAKVANPVGMQVSSLLVEAEGILAAVNVSRLDEAAKAAAQLGEIDRKLGAITGGNGRVAKARKYVQERLRELKIKSIGSF